MTTTATRRHRMILPAIAASVGVAVIAVSANPFIVRAQDAAPEAAQSAPPPTAEPAPADPAAELAAKRDQTRAELETLSKTINLSGDKVSALQQSIADLEKSTQSIRQALIESAARRKTLDRQILESEKKLADLGVKQDGIRRSLHERRGLLAEVLAALQRMGRNPPPALLVTPDDALASVRSAILLGAVVPGIRKETDKLAADLASLAALQTASAAEKAGLTATMTDGIEEERRMDLLLAENDKLSRSNAAELAAEKKRSEELAGKATSLEGLVASMESEIASVRDAAAAARQAEENRKLMTDEQRAQAKALADSGVPDKNRIAPAYPFGELKAKLEVPVAGDILRQFGDADGTGHEAMGMTVATNPETVVTAPADGLVVFAGAFRSYGQMIILDTGDGYHLVLSGMDTINTRQGKFVFSGEPLAVMGAKRVASATALALETDRPTLYIEFRKDGKPVDSRPWWTAKDTGKARNDS
ncbi:septal ring factor EnvC (AmiA/AmiB activator) [Rhizobium leguminosarum]|uniref:Septal ring factor EnvC (AmiA/AmiB activator) n=2 Tax=Rhizobium/Agrobacterium group TaxID=227290 RepID=A0AAE2MLS7_RHILE|nr:septal ring factor EnvC (AmiA/AmiB activator) [Rhizobium leguminosarum]MBB4433858.1 septal ring factor EnvC (AmiA/AmiB activator) [Rhizobium esperanzae]MBB4298236.1 septal ring factor EnvC (AmiA/AmiB activator) [Rhizobium leguminosarum]MBB4309374.1 septal ring factor EnvC (AmiA/AmiB activator) [Rhizobium leguminosarum]MBB4418811.1 septal ring factor EnvC (AmiA/AmiB activator) [Rhizobium leguminosarum]